MEVITADPRRPDQIMQELEKNYPFGPFTMWSKTPDVDSSCRFSIINTQPALTALFVFVSIDAIILATTVYCCIRTRIYPPPSMPA
jgi:hypothetical protein